MTLKLYYTDNDNNVLNKSLTNETELSIVLLEPTSKENPVVRIHKTESIEKSLPTYNYAYIGAPFNRYYYITDVKSVSGHTWDLTLAVDVLMSFKDDILKLNCIIERSEKYYDTYINDSSYVVENKVRTQTKEFPHGFENDTFVLTVCG